MGKGFAITTDLNLGKMLLAGYSRHCGTSDSNGNNASNNSSKLEPAPLPKIRVAAITNDTVATFTSLAYAVKSAPNSRVAMGLIVGTGTNATVPMKLKALHPTKKRALPNPDAVDMVIINTEWTIRGTDKPLIDLKIKTPWDLTLDANSDAPGFQPFEYMTSGRYLGEIIRLVLVDIISKDLGAVLPPSLQSKNAMPLKFFSEIVAQKGGRIVQKELESRYPTEDPSEPFWTVERIEMLRDIAEAVQQRSSALIAAACVGLLHCVGDIEIDDPANSSSTSGGVPLSTKVDTEELVIAYAGGVIAQYPKWLQTCQQWIDILVEEGSKANVSKTVTLKEALDGGLIGAGVLASVAAKVA